MGCKMVKIILTWFCLFSLSFGATIEGHICDKEILESLVGVNIVLEKIQILVLRRIWTVTLL